MILASRNVGTPADLPMLTKLAKELEDPKIMELVKAQVNLEAFERWRGIVEKAGWSKNQNFRILTQIFAKLKTEPITTVETSPKAVAPTLKSKIIAAAREDSQAAIRNRIIFLPKISDDLPIISKSPKESIEVLAKNIADYLEGRTTEEESPLLTHITPNLRRIVGQGPRTQFEIYFAHGLFEKIIILQIREISSHLLPKDLNFLKSRYQTALQIFPGPLK